jgi:hypothetical protein
MTKEQLLERAEQLAFDINSNITEQPQQQELDDLLVQVVEVLESVGK